MAHKITGAAERRPRSILRRARMRSTAVRVSPFHATQAQRVAILARHANDLCVEIAPAGVLD